MPRVAEVSQGRHEDLPLEANDHREGVARRMWGSVRESW